MEKTVTYNGYLITKTHFGWYIGTSRFPSLKQAKLFIDRMNAEGQSSTEVTRKLTAQD